jgi:hypothetical protein
MTYASFVLYFRCHAELKAAGVQGRHRLVKKGDRPVGFYHLLSYHPAVTLEVSSDT